jgi:hypothetical protein
MKTLVDCGCETKVHPDGSGVELYFCPLHEAAEMLLRVMRQINEVANDRDSAWETRLYQIRLWSGKAVRIAEGK